MRASIDIGSNSILLTVGDVSSGLINEVFSASTVTALGRGLERLGRFDNESLEDSYRALESYKLKAHQFGVPVSEIIATATEASRVASNAGEFFSRVKSELGINVQVITGQAEAYFTALGVSLSDSGATHIIDIGGASTEVVLTSQNPFKVLSSISMPLGSVRANSWADNKSEKIKQILKDKLSSEFNTQKAVFVAGTMTSVGNIFLQNKEFDEKAVDSLEMTSDELLKLKQQINLISATQILELYPFLGKRSATIHSGVEIACALVEALGIKKFMISCNGLRHGTLYTGDINERFLC